MKLSKFTKGASRGFSLIELLLVIGFIAGALVLAFITYPKVQATNRANIEAQHLTIISGGIKNLYGTARNFGTLTNTVLINSRIVPDDMAIAGAVISNVWGGTVTVTPVAGANNLRYQIDYTAVPQAECIKLATGVSTNFISLSLNGAVIFDRQNTSDINIDPAVIAVNCAGGGAANAMTFIGN